MANSYVQLTPIIPLRHVDKRRSTSAAGSTDDSIGTPANYASIDALDTRLAAISATAYSAANLRMMSVNDKIFALRSNDDSAGMN